MRWSEEGADGVCHLRALFTQPELILGFFPTQETLTLVR
jgi:hypothetical protein